MKCVEGRARSKSPSGPAAVAVLFMKVLPLPSRDLGQFRMRCSVDPHAWYFMVSPSAPVGLVLRPFPLPELPTLPLQKPTDMCLSSRTHATCLQPLPPADHCPLSERQQAEQPWDPILMNSRVYSSFLLHTRKSRAVLLSSIPCDGLAALE